MKFATSVIAIALAFSLCVLFVPSAQSYQAVQISGMKVEHDHSTARISWNTNIPASAIVRYGTSTTNLDQTAEAPAGSTTHQVELKNLKPSTLYYFQIQSAQAQGASSSTPIDGFTTNAAPAGWQPPSGSQASTAATSMKLTNGPVIEHIDNDWATIAWSTSGSGTTVLRYGTDPNNLSQVAHDVPESGPTNRVYIRNLQPNTTYYFQVTSEDGSQKLGDVKQLKTKSSGQASSKGGDSDDPRLDRAPTVEHVDATWATVAWSTHGGKEKSVLKYGTDPNNLNMVAHDVPESGATNRVYLRNLKPNTTYYFQVASEDGSKVGKVGQLKTKDHESSRASK